MINPTDIRRRRDQILEAMKLPGSDVAALQSKLFALQVGCKHYRHLGDKKCSYCGKVYDGPDSPSRDRRHSF